MPHVTRTLSAEAGARIDALLGQPVFWRGRARPHANNRPPPLGLMVRRIDVVTPACAQRWVTAGDQPPLLAELDALVTPE